MNIIHINPFLTTGYASKEYFCDRQNELNILQRSLKNENNLTLISARRLGKSALIYRLFESLEEENHVCIYVDVFATLNLKDFIECLALAIFKRFPEKKSLGKRFLDFLKSFRPVISYDALNGQPEIHFEFSRPAEYEHTLRSIFRFLDNQQVKVILAIDEFQQITAYPETNTEALLRTIIQTLQNIRFVFSGSKKHLMLEMFNTAKRPFFASTQMLNLSEIPTLEYKNFIRRKFEEHRRTIDDESIDFILSWTLVHTYYTQVICNQVFAQKEKHVGIAAVKRVC
ncbi:MAG: ATP-binding protein, partial [Bacteroidales bacterium]|nr:ATP-binding protein [Bacteroidales bacterium]